MRRIAAELGFGVMSLYNHVPNKAALLDAISEYVMADLQFAAHPQADWRDQARALVRAFREVSRRYPRSVNVVIMRQLNSPAGLRPLELALATARAAGFDGVTAVRVMRVFRRLRARRPWSTRPGWTRRDAGAAEGLGGYADPARSGRVPQCAGLGQHADGARSDADFEFGLDLLITAVTALPRTVRLPRPRRRAG